MNTAPYIFTVGNIKGGAGKTTVAMHIISWLLSSGLTTASIDLDIHQHSLTTYMQNRKRVSDNSSMKMPMPNHYYLDSGTDTAISDQQVLSQFYTILEQAKQSAHVIVIDTPGHFCELSSIAHSYADTIVTPLNDSFLDLDLIAEVDFSSLAITKSSIYTDMVWKQKLTKAHREKGTINWVIVRNRLTNLDARNKRAVAEVLQNFQKKYRCLVADGFSERVVYKELFLQGMTLLDLDQKRLSLSHVMARQELRSFMKSLGLKDIRDKYLNMHSS